jgi:glycosyltransferase involved in cell wall biosynthesis
MKSIHQKQKIISHFVGLSGIGGVQSNFVEYMKSLELHQSKYRHRVYTFGHVDSHYQFVNDILDIRKLSNLYKLILDIVSAGAIVHFYNNLSSLKVAIILFFLPVRRLVVHERGTIWSQRSSSWIVPRFVAWKASIILSNSLATKTMLVRKFSIPEKKIRVLHNGINIFPRYDCNTNTNTSNPVFCIGFIGRLDPHKGVHVLIDAMHYLANKKIELIIAGEGILENTLKRSASKLNNVKFIGRVKNPYLFMNKIDLLVVPSIREPLGNVCLEAGLCKTPVLAANIDGLPEIIENGVSGELVNATDKISIELPRSASPLPEFVVDPITQDIYPPRQINSSLLADRILKLSAQPQQLKIYADRLNCKVINYFNINRYRTELHKVYHELFFTKSKL